MGPKLTPTFFYGAATAAALGLSLGLVLHGPWEKHAGGPQIWFPSAAAEALARPSGADEAVVAEAEYTGDPITDDPLLYAGYMPANPLPVTRLAPGRYDGAREQDQDEALASAAFDVPQREDVDTLTSVDVSAYEQRAFDERPAESRPWEPGLSYPY